MANYDYFPMAPLQEILDARDLNVGDQAKLLGVSHRVLQRWRKVDQMPSFQHDRVACCLGLEPEEIWGEMAVNRYWAARDPNRTAAREYEKKHGPTPAQLVAERLHQREVKAGIYAETMGRMMSAQYSDPRNPTAR